MAPVSCGSGSRCRRFRAAHGSGARLRNRGRTVFARARLFLTRGGRGGSAPELGDETRTIGPPESPELAYGLDQPLAQQIVRLARRSIDEAADCGGTPHNL